LEQVADDLRGLSRLAQLFQEGIRHRGPVDAADSGVLD
jgi:hypothetical protein